jgi:glutaredoxin
LNIEIYTKDFCIWCDRAKSLLESNNLSFTEIDLSDDSARSEFYSKLGEGVKTCSTDIYGQQTHWWFSRTC